MDRATRPDRETLADAIGRRGLSAGRRRLLIVNPNTDTRVTQWLVEEARRIAGEDVAVVAVNAASGLAALETPDQIESAARAVEAAVAQGAGAAAAIIGAFGDPGLREARARALTPVIGLGEAGMRAAGRDGRRFTILTLGAAMEKPLVERARALGLGDALAQVRVLPFSISDLVEERAAYRRGSWLESAIGAGLETCDAEAVLLGGAPFAGLARPWAQRTGRLILDGVQAAVEAAVEAARAA